MRIFLFSYAIIIMLLINSMQAMERQPITSWNYKSQVEENAIIKSSDERSTFLPEEAFGPGPLNTDLCLKMWGNLQSFNPATATPESLKEAYLATKILELEADKVNLESRSKGLFGYKQAKLSKDNNELKNKKRELYRCLTETFNNDKSIAKEYLDGLAQDISDDESADDIVTESWMTEYEQSKEIHALVIKNTRNLKAFDQEKKDLEGLIKVTEESIQKARSDLLSCIKEQEQNLENQITLEKKATYKKYANNLLDKQHQLNKKILVIEQKELEELITEQTKKVIELNTAIENLEIEQLYTLSGYTINRPGLDEEKSRLEKEKIASLEKLSEHNKNLNILKWRISKIDQPRRSGWLW